MSDIPLEGRVPWQMLDLKKLTFSILQKYFLTKLFEGEIHRPNVYYPTEPKLSFKLFFGAQCIKLYLCAYVSFLTINIFYKK